MDLHIVIKFVSKCFIVFDVIVNKILFFHCIFLLVTAGDWEMY